MAAAMMKPQRDEYHISEERLLKLASEPKHRPSDVEDAHLDNCSQCFRKLVELVRMFYNMGDVIDPHH
jgi:predicted anti-sigma-YlaC factor YlaD